MKRLTLMLLDYDDAYLSRLNDYISNMYKGRFEISCFTSKDILLDQIKDLRNKDILIVNEEFYDESLESLGIKVILQLVEEDIDTTNESKLIHKYKDINNINEKIINLYKESNSEDLVRINSNNAETRIVSIYSPVGGSGKSSLAAGISIALSELGKEVFYLNLEDIQSTSLYFESRQFTSLSDVIFEIKDRADNYVQKLVAGIGIDEETEVSFLNPTENILDIEDMNEEDIRWLLEGIVKTEKYHYIIIDMGSKFNSLYNLVLNSSNYIITPLLNNEISRIKLEKYVSDINNLEKYFFIYNNVDNFSECSNLECLTLLNSEISLVIKEDKRMRMGYGIDAINVPSFREAINIIINKLGL
ncbi:MULTISPECIES: AAA family ATPase [unclassified Clostridium]|uniref:AAA family ATPase n=2 Tax=Clostridium TaxID=1485 RepID=UPI0025F65CD3|nr:AAA family ATPase [Clostridium sp.]MCI6693201.1 AAA family ATPase [Clostridium sp.]MDY4251715.1 AAA family ATPase [Clostridium sp.]MDY6229116.1 AAA family ATPase [Clostridium sp.]